MECDWKEAAKIVLQEEQGFVLHQRIWWLSWAREQQGLWSSFTKVSHAQTQDQELGRSRCSGHWCHPIPSALGLGMLWEPPGPGWVTSQRVTRGGKLAGTGSADALWALQWMGCREVRLSEQIFMSSYQSWWLSGFTWLLSCFLGASSLVIWLVVSVICHRDRKVFWVYFWDCVTWPCGHLMMGYHGYYT